MRYTSRYAIARILSHLFSEAMLGMAWREAAQREGYYLNLNHLGAMPCKPQKA